MPTSRWKCRLKGGPFDGDKGDAEFDNGVPPEVLWVRLCGKCKDTHWHSKWTRGAEVYGLEESSASERTALYTYLDSTVDNGLEVSEQEDAPVEVEREKELAHA